MRSPLPPPPSAAPAPLPSASGLCGEALEEEAGPGGGGRAAAAATAVKKPCTKGRRAALAAADPSRGWATRQSSRAAEASSGSAYGLPAWDETRNAGVPGVG
jgi:hypothetical protein